MSSEFEQAYGDRYPFGDGYKPVDDKTAPYPLFQKKPSKEYTPHPKSVYSTKVEVTPPDSFKLKPVDPKKAPATTPVDTLPALFDKLEVFTDVDALADEVTIRGFSSIRDLIWNLIFSREITNEAEKARLIFRWLCQNDPKSLQLSDFPSHLCGDTHSMVFQVLCQNAGLHCHLIRGHVKLYSGKPGIQVSEKDNRHSWNAVFVDGAWRFVDCCWASRITTGTKHFPGRTRKKFDNFYFMPPPQLFCITHHPDDQNWQLMSKPFTKDEFEKHVYLSAHFTHYLLQLLSHKEGVVTTDKDVTVTIGFPAELKEQMSFMFSLEYDTEGDLMRSQQLNRLVQYHRTLNGYGMMEKLDNTVLFTIRPPEKGSYRFMIYAKNTGDEKEEKYQSVCNYEIQMTAQKGLSKFPPCTRDTWGPHVSAKELGITPVQSGAIIKNSDGWLDIDFRVDSELDFLAKLKAIGQDEMKLEEFMMYRFANNVATFTITFPKAGEYGLEVFANHRKGFGEKLKHIGQYLIQAEKATSKGDLLPVIPPGFLGPKISFKQLGLSAISHPDPIIKTDVNKLSVVLQTKQLLNYSANLIFISDNKHEDKSEFIFRQGMGEKIEFLLNLPKAGWYRLELYAVDSSNSSQRLPNVYNYIINCQINPPGVSPAFPKQYTSWHRECYLIEPLYGLKSGTTHFKVKVPDADGVAVIVDEKWIYLEEKGGVWSGDVEINQRPGKQMVVKVSAKFPQKKDIFSTLLQYIMKI